MISLGSIRTEERDGETVIPDDEEDKLLTKLADKVAEKRGTEVEVRSESENPAVEDIWIAGQPLGKIINGNRETAKSAEKQARATGCSGSEPKGNDGENVSDDDLLPIERLLRGEDRDDWHAGNATESVERAKKLFRHFREWSSNTQKGRVIKTSGGKRGTATLKNLLNTVLDGPEISWKQVYRACHKLEEWTKGAIQFTDHRRHGKMLVMDERASSVGDE
jgi:hypothetical protein